MTRIAVWQRVVLTALTIYPTGMIAVATANGPGIGIDSVSYAAAAESWAASAQLLTYDGSDLSIFPVGLPIVIGTLMAAGMSLSFAVILTNALATGLTVLAAYFLGRQVLRAPGWALLAAAGVALSASTVRVGSYLWTEPVFTALIAWILVLVAWAIRKRRGEWWIPLVAGALVSVATTYRYVGVVAVPVVAIGVAWATPRHRVFKGLLAALVGSVGLVASAGRNLLLGTAPLGERYPGSVDAQGAVLGLVRMWGEYLAPSSTTSLTVVFGALVSVLLVAGAWLVAVARNGPGRIIAVFVAVYWVSILVSQVGTRLDVATERFGAPVLVPSMILAMVAVRAVLDVMSRQLADATHRDLVSTHQWLMGAVAVAALGVVGLSMLQSFRFASSGFEEGLGFNSETADSRSVSVVAADLPIGTVVASNDPWQVWWSRAEGPVLDYPPSRSEWPPDRVDRDVERLVDAVDEQGSVLVVLDSGSRASLPVTDLLAQGLVVEELDVRDGVQVLELRSSA